MIHNYTRHILVRDNPALDGQNYTTLFLPVSLHVRISLI